MKNVKLTLATTLSVLALTFAGTASADGGNNRDYRFNNHKQQNVIAKSKFTKNINRNAYKNTYKNKRVVKRVVVKNTPTTKATPISVKMPVAEYFRKAAKSECPLRRAIILVAKPSPTHKNTKPIAIAG